jgi:hypothetical protein
MVIVVIRVNHKTIFHRWNHKYATLSFKAYQIRTGKFGLYAWVASRVYGDIVLDLIDYTEGSYTVIYRKLRLAGWIPWITQLPHWIDFFKFFWLCAWRDAGFHGIYKIGSHRRSNITCIATASPCFTCYPWVHGGVFNFCVNSCRANGWD